jgi:hypothetical protein
MTTPNLTPAPDAPQRSDPSTFASRADAFLTWWVNVIAELNAFVTWVKSIADSITSSSNYWSAANVVNAADINCSLGVYFTKTVNSPITFTFSNPPASGRAYSFTLCITHVSGAIGWPTAVRWLEDTPPYLSTGKVHEFVFSTTNGGTTWLAKPLPNFPG